MGFLKAVTRFLDREIIAPEHLPIVRGEQISAFKKALPFGICATFINATIISGYVLVFGSGPGWNVWLWAGIMALTLGVGIPAAYKAHKSKKDIYPRPAKDMRKPLISASAISLSWAIGLVLLIPGAPDAQQFLLTTVCAGMMCGGAYIFSTVPRAAVIFVSTIAAGFAVSQVLNGLTGGTVALILLLLCYTFVMICAAFWNYTNYVRAWLQQIELNAQKAELGHQYEVINLLLKDFEQTASDHLWETDKDANLLRLSDDLAGRLNISADTPMPKKFAALLEKGGAEAHDVMHIFNEAAATSFFRDYIIRIKTDNGDRWLSFSGKRKQDGGYRGVVADITDAQVAEAKIRYLAHYDGLTGLANRHQLRLDIAIALQDREEKGEGFAILCLDLDRFKIVNDAHGHLAGDQVLSTCAERMRACIESDNIAARVGGDEFIILQRNKGSARDAQALANKIIAAIEKPIEINDLIVQISASIGISLCPQNGVDANTLLKSADLALYRAKQDGRARFCFFEQHMDDTASERRAVEADLRIAIREGQFRLFFQPLVDGLTRRAVGFEALLRWEHPERGIIVPEEFINIAEQTGMISVIGEWVIREALKEASCWTDGQSISINLSPLQVKSPTLVSCVINALASTGVAPSRLEFEITESVLLDESESSLRTLRELHDLGIRISLDDFGTGYSSLSYLSSFPFDKIKIDKSFVQAIGDSNECRAIVRAVAGLAQSLGMRSTAEGLETQEQIESVLAEGCSELQGFYFSKPQSAETLEEAGLLRRGGSGAFPDQKNQTTDSPIPSLMMKPGKTGS